MRVPILDQDRAKIRDIIAEILGELEIPWSPEGQFPERQGQNLYYDGYYIPPNLRTGGQYHFLSFGKRDGEAYLAPTFSNAEQVKFTNWMLEVFTDAAGQIGTADIFTSKKYPGLSLRTNRTHDGTQSLTPAIYIDSVKSAEKNRAFLAEIIRHFHKNFRL